MWREPAPEQAGLPWDTVWDHWDAIEADLLERMHIDMWTTGWDMPWHALLERIQALLDTPVGLVVVPVEDGHQLRPVPVTRIQAALQQQQSDGG